MTLVMRLMSSLMVRAWNEILLFFADRYFFVN